MRYRNCIDLFVLIAIIDKVATQFIIEDAHPSSHYILMQSKLNRLEKDLNEDADFENHI